HPRPSKTFGKGQTFLDTFRADKFSSERDRLPYYPFQSQAEWEFAAFLERCNLSNAEVDELLSLDMIKQLPLSFRSFRELREQVEILPAGPQWHFYTLSVDSFPTKKPIRLFYRDTLECVEFLFGNPLFHDHMDFDARRVFTVAERAICQYSEWMTGDAAWAQQNAIPAGATLAGVILSSDKTTLT
ncbi:hypothetical protein DENSPDRAFT_757192, partial [Dentipellis sp. KUC8613]